MESRIYTPSSKINLKIFKERKREHHKEYITSNITFPALALSYPLSIVGAQPTIQQMQMCQATVD